MRRVTTGELQKNW